jgi:hypothetical protein
MSGLIGDQIFRLECATSNSAAGTVVVTVSGE